VIRVVLPAHLKNLAHVSGELQLDLTTPGNHAHQITQRQVLDALETRYPMLLGTIRDRHSGQRRPYVRFYGCEEDLSNSSPDTPLPDQIIDGREPFIILGAMAGG
jgi:sulfur-carrier protein